MDKGRIAQESELSRETSFWKPSGREGEKDTDGFISGNEHKPLWINHPAGSIVADDIHERSTETDNFHSVVSADVIELQTSITIAAFVSTKFVPEHVATKLKSGRLHYQAILKHVLTPGEVDFAFQAHSSKLNGRIPEGRKDWPYLGQLRLSDASPDHVQKLVYAAMEAGYSTQTVTHIRNVVSAIFSHAIRARCFSGSNPASLVALPGRTHKKTHSLTFIQAKAVIKAMHYPEKEMALISILTNMNMAEICGLRWKFVNLSNKERLSDGVVISAQTIAVRNQWHRGELGNVKKRRLRLVPIPAPLFPILHGLSCRSAFNSPEDYVLTSRNGTPINQCNIVARRLKPIGRQLRMPWLSWRAFRCAQGNLSAEFHLLFQDYLSVMVP